jgi:hypothetical protein
MEGLLGKCRLLIPQKVYFAERLPGSKVAPNPPSPGEAERCL